MSFPDDNTIKQVLDYDPLAHAEEITGESYNDSEDTSLLGMGLAFMHNEHRREVLSAAGDTHFGTTWDDFKSILALEGFSIIRTERFEYKDKDNLPEQIIAWHPDGVLVVADEWSGWSDRPASINGAGMYYAWKSTDRNNYWEFTSSGCFQTIDDRKPWDESVPFGDLVWMGHHDIRDAFRYKLRMLREHGTFVTPWAPDSWLWLLHYGDTNTEDYDHEAITERKLADFPEDIRKAINWGRK